MDVNDILNALNGVLELSDTLDNNGIGISSMTNGQRTTREVCKMELGQFLLYVGGGGSFFTDGQASLVNLLIGEKIGQLPAWQMKAAADSVDSPDAGSNVTFTAFEAGDEALSQQNGTKSTQMTDLLISLYESFGGLMVAFNEDALSRIRCDNYVSGLKSRQMLTAGSFSANVNVSREETEKTIPENKKVSGSSVSSPMKGGMFRFDKDIVLELPDGYLHETVEGDDGSKTEWIRYGRKMDDDGNTSYEFNISVNRIDCRPNPGTDEVRQPGEAPFDVMLRRIGNNGVKHMEFGDRNMAISIRKPVRLLGMLLKYKMVVLTKELDGDTAVSLQAVYSQDDDDPEQDPKTVRHLMILFGCMKIKGKKCSVTGLDEKKFAELAHCDFDEENDESAVNLKVGLKIKVGDGEAVDAGEINLSEKPKHADEVELPDPEVRPELREMWESWHEHYTLVTSGSYTSHRDADFRGQSIRSLMEKHGATKEKAYRLMRIPGDTYDLDQTALKLAKVFRMDERMFDPYNDTEALIREGMFKDVRALHALRSMAWAVDRITARSPEGPEAISYEKLEEIGELILRKDYLAYGVLSPTGLCSHEDWHVFYAPHAYMDSDVYLNTDLRYLTGKENRGGNSSFVIMGGDLSALRRMNKINELVGRNEETVKSLEELRKDLSRLTPVMETIHDGLLEGRDRSEKLEGVLADVLTAWCALAVAAKEPFYSEEAADSYEADAGLEGPLDRPTDELDDKPVKKAGLAGGKAAAKKSAAKKETKKPAPGKPAGDVLDLGGATVIEPGKFSGNMTLKNIVIPEGVTEIGEMAFYSCMFLESVVFPSSLKKIGKMAFMSCRALKKAELLDGIEEIGDHAFGATNNLKEMRLPDSLQTVNKYLFGMGGDSPYATAYMTGALACRLMESADEKSSWPSDAIYARRYVIDGVGYENMTDFWKKVKDGTVKVAPAAKSAPTPVSNRKQILTKENGTDTDAAKDPTALTPEQTRLAERIRETPPMISAIHSTREEYEANNEKRRKWMLDTYEILKEMFRDHPEPTYMALQRKTKKYIDWYDFENVAYRLWGDEKRLPQIFKEEGLVQPKKKTASAGVKKAMPAEEKKPAPKASPKAGSSEKPKTSTPAKKAVAKPAAKPEPKPAPAPAVQPAPAESKETSAGTGAIAENGVRFNVLKDRGPVIGDMKYMSLPDRYLEIPEGVTEIGNGSFQMGEFEILKLPGSLRKMGHGAFRSCKNLRKVIFQEGLQEIGPIAFENDPELGELHLPESLQKTDEESFVESTFTDKSSITVYLSGSTARRLHQNKDEFQDEAAVAKAFVIDGNRYSKISEYIANPKPAPRPVTAVPSRPTVQQSNTGDQKQFRRNQLRRQIHDLETERDSAKGLFAGMKRKKLQKQIDELTEQLNRL